MKYMFLMLAMICLPFLAVAESEVPQSWLKSVSPDHVCMVNNTVFDKPQIPVKIGDKTYYGCCEMCKGRLEKDTAMRTATDPVSGNEVDKSAAITGAAPDGTVYYFESQDNLEKFNPQAE